MVQLVPTTLQNDFVALEPLTLDHVAGLEQAAADGELWNLCVTYVPPPGAMRAYIEKALAMQATGESLPFAVRDKRDGAIAGSTRYYDFRPDVPRILIGHTWYGASRQRSHVNTACKLLLVEHAFHGLGCAAVGWETDHLNMRSQQAIERLGAHRDGVLRQHKRRHDGTIRDSVEYSMLASEWPQARSALAAKLRR
ncbi:MAG: GNAT family N-acetyltransferase [Xanthomonadales bacterium]|nr:GNAT family N-acetyltransferase [Xanthomonadales bacterium]ODU94967.1 MAG: GNAT family N-acetyltransferase [Rhodanobacter sp. SCN 66-43]OJY82287.1 MAG: GNAT family N-acetyltransferase [Xanthomonadales bacterium 66-474]